MTMEEKVAQLFIVAPESLSSMGGSKTSLDSDIKESMDKHAVGSIIFYEENIVSEDQTIEFTSDLQDYSKYPLFICVDEEGGSVTRLTKNLGLDDVGTAKSIGDTGDINKAYDSGVTLGNYLKKHGFNVDFAPVADVGLAESDVINTRYYNSDPYTAADMVENATRGIQNQGVSATLKHFPGHGSTQDDSHTGIATTTRTLSQMYETEFLPFQSGIEAGADLIMVGHISAPNAAPDGDMPPASLSSFFVTDILRDSLNYNGIIITDAMQMGAITDIYDSGEAAVMAIKAGVDMILMPKDFKEAYNAVLDAVNMGKITEERIDESLKRIYAVKDETICTDHDFEETGRTDPTCTQQGTIPYTCKKCGNKKTEYIDATGHTPVTDKAVAATCENTGVTEGSHCAVCGEIIVMQNVIKLEGNQYTYSF